MLIGELILNFVSEMGQTVTEKLSQAIKVSSTVGRVASRRSKDFISKTLSVVITFMLYLSGFLAREKEYEVSVILI